MGRQSGWRAGFSGHSPTRMRSPLYPGADAFPVRTRVYRSGAGRGSDLFGLYRKAYSQGADVCCGRRCPWMRKPGTSLLEGPFPFHPRQGAGCSLFPYGPDSPFPVTADRAQSQPPVCAPGRPREDPRPCLFKSEPLHWGSWALCLLAPRMVGVDETAVGVPNEHGLRGKGFWHIWQSFLSESRTELPFQLHLQKERKDGDVCDQFSELTSIAW